MNKIQISKVLKIIVSITCPRLSWIVGVYFRQEFVGGGFRKGLELDVVTSLG